MAKRYSEELKQIMVGKYEGGATAKAICAEYGVSRSTLLLWAKQYSPDGDGQIPREQYPMRKELERLRIENQIFGIVAALRIRRWAPDSMRSIA